MLSGTLSLSFVALALISFSQPVLGRERWLERNGRAVRLNPRRFGQEHPEVITKLSAACPGEVCGNLAGGAITPLLAAQPECSQQDFADKIIDASLQFDAATQANMLALAIEYRQAEKNTPPDFTTNPPTNRNSVFCQKAPAHAELAGLVQAQDPANDPNLFFDPATGKSVKLGDQPNTFPFGGAVADDTSSSSAADDAASSTEAASSTTDSAASASATAVDDPDCVSATVTVTVAAGASSSTASSSSSSTKGKGKGKKPKANAKHHKSKASKSAAAAASTTAAADSASTDAAATTTVSSDSATETAVVSSNIGDFGSCSIPEITFAVGLDNRKETAFEPTDLTSYPHTSAQNIDIITQFICDTLVNSCKADQTAKDTCAAARAAVDTVTPKIGLQADTFNKFFGKITNFKAVQAVDNTGVPIPGTTS